MIAKRALFIACLGVPACTTMLPLNDMTHVSRITKLSNEYNWTVSTIRSYRTNAEGKKVEVPGAICSGSNGVVKFSRAVTPAVVNLPTYLQAERFPKNGRPPALRGRCVYNGKSLPFTLEVTSSVSNVSTTSGGTYNAQTGHYTSSTVTHLNSRLSSTLPWHYGSLAVEY